MLLVTPLRYFYVCSSQSYRNMFWRWCDCDACGVPSPKVSSSSRFDRRLMVIYLYPQLILRGLETGPSLLDSFLRSDSVQQLLDTHRNAYFKWLERDFRVSKKLKRSRKYNQTPPSRGQVTPECSCEEELREVTFIVPSTNILAIWHPTEAINYELNQNTV